MMIFNLRVGESVRVGEALVTVNHKSGASKVQLCIDAQKHIPVYKEKKQNKDFCGS